MLVGDIALAIREAVTDLPPTLFGPSNLVATPVFDPAGVIPNGTYYVVATLINQWGETGPSNEVQVIMAGVNNAIQVSVTPSAAQGAITSSKYYIGLNPGQEYLSFTAGYPGAPFNITDLGPLASAQPPIRNTAYLPDMDGDAVSAASMFRWINDALKLASQICGGLLDYSGVGSVTGSPQYIVPGQWKKISSMWYDGYPLAMDDNGNYFRRNTITASVLASVATSTFNNQMMIEIWPQPSRSAAITTLAAPLNIGQLTATLVSTANFLLTNGFVQIGTEIMSYSGLFGGNTLGSLQRALSGTVQTSWPIGTFVKELNLFWSGWRMYSPSFAPGSSLQTIPVPVGWETILPIYGLARMKLAEQNTADYEKLKGIYMKDLSDWFRTNKVTTGPRQIGEQSNGLEVIPSLGGGWVIPAVFPVTYVIQECYTPLLGGGVWQQFISIAFVILEAAMCAMLVKQIIQRSAKLRTSLNQCWNMVERKLSGFWNYALSVSDRNSASSRNATRIHGEKESGSGLDDMVGYAGSSTLVWEGNWYHKGQLIATELWAIKREEFLVHRKSDRKSPLLSKAISSLKNLGEKLERLTGFNFPILKRKNGTEKP